MGNKKMQASCKRLPAIENQSKNRVSKYCVGLHNRFSCLKEEEDLDKEWEGGLRGGITEASMEVLGQHPHRRKQQHLSQETITKDLTAERSKIEN